MASGHTATREKHVRELRVWDLPTRLFHWALVAAVMVAILSAELGVLAVHMLAGETVLILVLFRLGWGVVGSQTARFADFVKGPAAIRDYLKRSRAGGEAALILGHNPLGALMVVAILLVLLVQAGCGLFTSDDILVDGPLVHLISGATVALLSSLHRLLANGIFVLIGLHVAAVFFHLLVRKDNLIRPMVTGRKILPARLVASEPRRAPTGLALAILAASAGLVFLVLRAAG
ncbi:cytochrome B [Azospirillum sp. TSH100]|uniref:cytochrome b/b6 domain-containing protein n=1 Tax=Azospirillum sp. TSH100 TaxID=652764 RepID=UPI000D610B88|nr:cytochrome b/b6 domain-containing protein [Azospirillum sp. TSH100]PWC82296.1 cytochrome B [Azospirillum sp. TSH100]QCG86907.1 cytochrome B [Azospirillum sp. TSH100]